MFAVAFDPFLRDLERRIDQKGKGKTRACADDVAVVVYEMAVLFDIDAVYKKAGKLANLNLRLEKCLIIPFGGGGFYKELRIWLEWIGDNAAHWLEVPIAPNGTYLGMILGRGGAQKS